MNYEYRESNKWTVEKWMFNRCRYVVEMEQCCIFHENNNHHEDEEEGEVVGIISIYEDDE